MSRRPDERLLKPGIGFRTGTNSPLRWREKIQLKKNDQYKIR